MSDRQCPICFGELEVRDVAPCWECGHLPEELDHFRVGLHTYAEVEIGEGLRHVLCNICQVDLGSMPPAHFGLPADTPMGYERMRLVRERHDAQIAKDKYCPSCGHRLAWLKAVAAIRERFSGGA